MRVGDHLIKIYNLSNRSVSARKYLYNKAFSPNGEILINSENPTLNKAIQAIKELFEDVGNVQWQTKYVEALLDNKWKIDVIISLTINHKTQKLLVEVKSSGEPRIIAQAAGYLKRATEIYGGYPVLVAPFVSSRGRELCKELGIGFVDLAGNAYIRSDGVLIEHWGK
ncbi:MAG: hypothetical protein KAU14_08045, partial [Thermoplasmata archaeon]|nr:hypothetical protein [Thermoplasmata archaeon]